MINSKLNIPDNILVGFQERKDTYTGRLAYVIYYDNKNKLRKEPSWNNWRNKNIESEKFKNEPIEGFVLNKKVGGNRYGWNPRSTYVRVYDPRGFEFEISIPNLIFILEECSSVKGKGLEGSFVYAWDRADLVLLPVSSMEYETSKKHTELQGKRVSKKDMTCGCSYIDKKGVERIYLGRHLFFDSEYDYGKSHYIYSSDKKHIFKNIGSQDEYWTQKGFTQLATKVSDEPLFQYPDEYDNFKKSFYGFCPVKAEYIPKDLSKAICDIKNNKYHRESFFVREHGEYYLCFICQKMPSMDIFVEKTQCHVEIKDNKNGIVIVCPEVNYYYYSKKTISINELGNNKVFRLRLTNSENIHHELNF